MNLFIYTDESGVFDHINNDFFVFGGLIFQSKSMRDIETRKYLSVEKSIRRRCGLRGELKACVLSNKHKGQLFRSMNAVVKFGVVINQKMIHERIFDHKKSKQRYLDYAYKIGLKRALLELDSRGSIKLEEIENIYVFCDEHTTATDGRYELEEGLLREFKYGTFNETWNKHFPPICSNVKRVVVQYLNSEKKVAIRMADIVANRLYHHAVRDKLDSLKDKIIVSFLP